MLVAPFLPKADVVLSTSPQFFNGLGGYFVSRMKRCPWVLEIRDLWPESILVVGAIRNRAIIRMLEYLEGFAQMFLVRLELIGFLLVTLDEAVGQNQVNSFSSKLIWLPQLTYAGGIFFQKISVCIFLYVQN